MGYFGTASVLTTEPDWERLDGIEDLKSIRGYQHKTQPLWLIETGYRPERKADWPFMEYPCSKPKVSPDNADRPIIEAKEAIEKVITGVRDAFDVSGIIYLDIAIRLASALDQTVFTFAADDESVDLACQVSTNRIDLFVSKSLTCLYEFSGDKHQVNLYPDEEEPEETAHLEEYLASLCAATPWAEAEIKPFDENNSLIYYCAHNYWPKQGGSPEAMLGVGTWDPFMNLKDDYEQVYEKIFIEHKTQPSKAPPKPSHTVTSPSKPWWKFW